MNYFQTVNIVLNTHVAALAASYGISIREVYDRMIAHLDDMSKEWTKGSQPNIQYGDPFCRLAYIYAQVAVNANLFDRALKAWIAPPNTRSVTLGSILAQRMLVKGGIRIAAFGGGPGTELLAMAKYLVASVPLSRPVDVDLVLLDRVSEWSESWIALRDAIYAQLGSPRMINFTSSFIPFDFTQIANYGNLPTLLQRDLFVLNYVVSELYEPAVLSNLATVVSGMARVSPDAPIVILDRNDGKTMTKVNELLANAGLISVSQFTVGGRMDDEEQSAVLAAHSQSLTKPGERQRTPRVSWMAGPYRSAAAFVTIAKAPAATWI